MVTFIVLFLPAVLSVWIWEVICGKALCKKNWIYLLSLNVILINFGCFAVKKWLLLTAGNSLSSPAADMTPSAAVNYLIMAVPAAVVLAFIEKFFFKKVRLRVEGDDEDATDNNTTEEK